MDTSPEEVVGKIGKLDLIEKSEPSVDTFENKYAKGSKLGEGGFASVFIATKLATREDFAVKIFQRAGLGKFENSAIFSEYAILKTLNHDNIVRVYDFYEEPTVYKIVMEIVAGGELFDRIVDKTCYSEKDARDVMAILLSAVKHCHDRHVVHRDLKPENLLMVNESDDAAIKLADFGFATVAPKNTLTDDLGTPSYIAPEIYTHNRAKGPLVPIPYGKPVDMWAVGVILFILLAGYFPFDGTDEEVRELTLSGQYEFTPEHFSHISEEAKELVRGLLTTDAEQRLTAQQALSHPWMAQASDVLESFNLMQGQAELRESIDRIRQSEMARMSLSGGFTERFSISGRSMIGTASSGSVGGDDSSSTSSGSSSSSSSGSGSAAMMVGGAVVYPGAAIVELDARPARPLSVAVPIPAKHSGYMKKRPVKARFGISAWQKRFFILERGVLSYFLRETSYGSKIGHDKKGEIRLEGFCVRELIEAGHVYIQLESHDTVMVVDASEQKGTWVNALQKHIVYKSGGR